MKIDERKMKINWIGKIANYFVNHLQLAGLLIILILLFGYFSYQSISKESLPEITFPALSIQVVYPGASAEDIEALVTNKIEDKLLTLDDLDNIQSSSNFGISVISVAFEEGVDMDRKQLEVDNKLSEIDLPEDSFKPIVNVFKTSEIPLISFSVVGDYDEETLTNYAKDIQKRLEKIQGIEEVKIFGQQDREIQLLINPVKMMSYQLSIRQVQNALSGINVALPITEVEQGGTRYNFRVDETIDNPEVIGDIAVQSLQNVPIFISDVSEIVDTYKETNEINRSYVVVEENGKKRLQPSIFLQVIRASDKDVLEASESVRKSLSEMKGTLYPEDVTVYISQDTAIDVSNDLQNIQNSAVSGLIVVIIVLFLFIGFKESLVVALTVPLSLLGTLGFLSLFNMTLNTLVVLGIIVSLGLLVDNAIIVMENMNRLRLKSYGAKDAAVYGVNQVGYPIFAATLTTIAAFFPLAILPGILGAFVNSIPRTVIITLGCSFVVAITIIPGLYYLLFREKTRIKSPGKIKNAFKKLGQKKALMVTIKVVFVGLLATYAFSGPAISPVITGVIVAGFIGLMLLKLIKFKDRSFEDSKTLQSYERGIVKVVKSPFKKGLVILIAVGLLVTSFGLIATGQLKIAFFPQNEPDNIVLVIDGPGGTTLETMNDITGQVEDILMTLDEVATFNTTIGGSEIDKSIINVELSEMQTTGFEQLETIKSAVENVPGADIFVQGQSSGGPPVASPIEIIIEGEDLQGAIDLADLYKEKLQSIEGVYNVTSSVDQGTPEKTFKINGEKAQFYGITPLTLAVELRGLLSGSVATEMVLEGESVEVITKLAPEFTDQLESIYISGANGQKMPLSNIGEIVTEKGFSSIQHKDGIREITIKADVLEGYNAGELLETFKKEVENIPQSPGLMVVYGGDAEGIQESFTNLFRSMILAIFLVFIILSLQFNSIVQPFIIVLTIPMAIIGVMWGLFITGNEFGFYAFMALVALVGIAVNDAIVLIDYMNQLRRSGAGLYEAIGEATKTRFNPVLATTLTTIGGILPLAFNNVYYQQFAYALIFGLLVTTLMTLVLIPAFYSILSKKIKIDGSKREV